MAGADGCQYTSVPNEYACGVVYGEKRHVEKMDVIRGKYPGGTIPDYHATVSVRTPRGDRLDAPGEDLRPRVHDHPHQPVVP